VALMPLSESHIGFQTDSMGSNETQEYPFKKVNALGFGTVLKEKWRSLK
jgi:hypothetical protein